MRFKPQTSLFLLVMSAWLAGCTSQLGTTSLPGATPGVSGAFASEYRLYSPTSADHVYTLGAQRFADLIRQRTNGRITITAFPDGQLAKGEREALEGLQQGTIDLYVGSTGAVGNFADSFLVLDLPFLFRDHTHADKVLDGPVGQSLLNDLNQARIKGLALWENGFRNLTNDLRPVSTPGDVKGLRLRTMENQVHLEAWALLGAFPTPMVWSAVYEALRQRAIDAQENPVAVIYSGKIYEVQKHLTLTHHVYSPALIAMSAAKFQQMPHEDQKLFAATAAEVAPYQRRLGRDQEARQITELKQKGVAVVDSIETAAWVSALKPVSDKYGERFADRLRQIAGTR